MTFIRTKIAALFALLMFLNSCASTSAPTLSVGQKPELNTDEAGLWMSGDRAEKEILNSPLRVKDPKLTAYVEGLVCRLAGPRCPDIRVYVVDLPYLNASMHPNGMMQVWTGLLLRADNEAQLAYVIGHEIAHYAERHSLERWRTAKNNTAAALIFAIGAGLGGVPELATLGNLAAISNIFGHSRENEREADQLGFEMYTKAGYDPKQSAEIWKNLVAEVESSDFEKKRKQQARAGAFDTHPLTAERIAVLESLSSQASPSGFTGEEAFQSLMDEYLDRWLRSDLRRKDYGESLFLLSKLERQNRRPGAVNFFRGEVYRLRRLEGDPDLAKASYERAIRFDDAPPEAWRALGQVYRDLNQDGRAAQLYTTYLEKAPNAPDRILVQNYLNQTAGYQ